METNLVFTVTNNSERSHNKGYEFGIKSWKNWCQLNNVPFFVYNHSDENVPAQWYKYKIFDILKSRGLSYSKILFVDADTVVGPKFKSIFTLTDKLGAVPNFGSIGHVQRSIENYGSFILPNISLSYTEYFNTGVLLFNENHKEFFRQINEFYKINKEKIQKCIDKYKSGQDQTIVNLLAKQENIEVELLSFKYNIQDLQRRECFRGDAEYLFFLNLISDGIWHFNCIHNPKEIIEEVYKKLWS